MDFREIVNVIFENKEKYSDITDEDKEAAFYMINKKFSIKYRKTARFFNDKNINKVSAIDLWFLKFKDVYKIPYWYWAKSENKKGKEKKLSKPDTKLVIEEFDLSNKEFDFLYKHFKDDVDYELKILKRWK